MNDTNLYYVGGVVRDKLLGCESRDIDLVYEGNIDEWSSDNHSIIQPFNHSTPFGTKRVNIAGREVDIASTRCETYPKPGHLPVITKIGCSLKDDVSRRDFTINALAMRVSDNEIIDYVGGQEDLKNKTLRVLHDKSFVDDPTRIIRGLKFAVRFGFELDAHTKALQDEYLANVNYDMCYKRVKDELMDTLNSQAAFEKFIEQKIYKLVTPNEVKLPEINIEELINQYLPPCHPEFISGSSTEKTCANPDGGRFRIKSGMTEYFGWLVYAGVLRDLSRIELTRVEKKILEDYGNPKTDFEIYKAFVNAPIEAILLHAILKDEKVARRWLDNLRNVKIETTGEDLQALGIAPSPRYGEIFDTILKAKLSNPSMTKAGELLLVNSLN